VYEVTLHPLMDANSPSSGYVAWNAGPNRAQSQATVVKSNNTYHITGTAAPVYQPGKSPSPFEFDVTCP
jgi:Flp pilus assembly protein TadG